MLSNNCKLSKLKIVINFFLFFCIFGDVLSQIAQTFIPYTFQKPTMEAVNNQVKNKPASSIWTENGRSIIQQIRSLALILGCMNAIIGVGLSTVGSKYFTTAKEVMHQMNVASPLLALCALPHCYMLGYEGVLIVSQDLTFLSKLYLITGVVFLVYQVS